MSSKEKRQLRNKISARNFRVRRKEYITTLEGDVAERDRLIDAIRTELGSTKSENAALREEISALKKALLTAANAPVLPPPGPLPSATRPVAPPTPLLTPNTQKDLPASPGLANKAFWGGSGMGAFGGVTSVHTTIIPESFARPLANVKPIGRRSPQLQENINPALNVPSGAQQQNSAAFGLGRPAPFDAFADTNPFTVKMLDAYRMQLWTRMAQQTRQQQQQQLQQQLAAQQQLPAPSMPITGLAANMRPAFFSSAKAPGLSSLLAGKHPERAYPSPPASPHMSPKLAPKPEPASPSAQHAVLAAMAQQTLFQRLGSAFWDAFAGQPAGAGARTNVDADKVRRVLEGKAVVRVVDVDETPRAVAPLSPRLTPALVSPRPTPAAAAVPVRRDCNPADCMGALTSALEESMRALSLGKK
ncbi:hypothetical protein K488DRAFT_51771 [Vararia minispora EC-137]|uniref:Uncharacterized protein n=1 Tax=Vararia minispora EC-137 TaxID=1314806 RepID=A0ACB8QIE4_9AGAM|nr:hypothetical protein K488DRAFT_51771 [Vararia minispora EC-137]